MKIARKLFIDLAWLWEGLAELFSNNHSQVYEQRTGYFHSTVSLHDGMKSNEDYSRARWAKNRRVHFPKVGQLYRFHMDTQSLGNQYANELIWPDSFYL